MQNFGLFQTERFADDKFRFVEKNGSKFSKWVENTLEKGEIAHNEQFFLFSLCFEKTFTADTLKRGLVWERVNTLCFAETCHIKPTFI